MIKQGFINNDSILEKKFKILRTSIMLGNLKDREGTLKEYEDTAREIDKIKKNVYEEILSSKMYTTTTLEEEKERLTELIDFIQKRIDERNEFIDDYIKITNRFLDDLDKVSKEEDLSDYKIRLDNITEYLNNVNEINNINGLLKEKKHELEEKYENKANNEIINNKLEEELIDEYNKIINSDEYYKNLNYIDIDAEVEKIDSSLIDKKDVLNTFVSSYEALKNAGISGAEREEYLSYVQDARNDYYHELEKKYILEIYKLVLDKESDYDRLLEKRMKINDILTSRSKDREELDIDSNDILEYFINVCKEQLSVIKAQKYNMENIDKLIVDISDYENRLEALERANNREEIQSILKEYQVDSPVIEKIDLPEEKKIYEDIVSKNIDNEKKPDNMVVRIEDAKKMNIKMASDTAKLVMKKVVIVLEPKKFNNKRDKIKEAELELAERKKQEKIKEQERKLEEEEKKKLEEIKKIEEKEKEVENTITNNVEEIPEEVDNSHIEVPVSGMINLDVKDVFTDDDPGETNYKDNSSKIEITFPEDKKEVTVPTEIIVEEPEKEKTVDLFKETDPFLDDNEFEMNDNNSNINSGSSDIPLIKNIGTVKPNNMLNKIEDMAKENNDIILPTMGLTDKDKESVPIVSENYIN